MAPSRAGQIAFELSCREKAGHLLPPRQPRMEPSLSETLDGRQIQLKTTLIDFRTPDTRTFHGVGAGPTGRRPHRSNHQPKRPHRVIRNRGFPTAETPSHTSSEGSPESSSSLKAFASQGRGLQRQPHFLDLPRRPSLTHQSRTLTRRLRGGSCVAILDSRSTAGLFPIGQKGGNRPFPAFYQQHPGQSGVLEVRDRKPHIRYCGI